MSLEKRLDVGSSSQSDQTKEDEEFIKNKCACLNLVIDLDERKVLKLHVDASIKENLDVILPIAK